MGSVRTAAIVGLNWGLVHVRGLREAGCDIVALASAQEDHAREAAHREGVPRATSDIASLDDVDVVVVATPAATHAAVLRQLPSPFLICEKPLIGLEGAASSLPATTGRLFVNYAFPFLNSAAAAADAVSDLGPPCRIELDVAVGLPQPFSVRAWWLEVASHPLSWLLRLLGPPTAVTRSVAPDRMVVRALAGASAVEGRLRVGGVDGIDQRIVLHWEDHVATISGAYRPGRLWRYDPVLLDGRPVTDGEWSASDCWLDANVASVRAMIEAFRGQRGTDDLFDAERALWLERTIRDDLSP